MMNVIFSARIPRALGESSRARIQKEEKVEFLTEKIGFFFVEFQKSKITFDFKAYI